MEIAFYLSGLVAILATIRVVSSTNPAHALLYLIISLVSVAMVFFALGAPFAGALEIIVYAGAIMVLFVFVVMMLNLGKETTVQERAWLQPRVWRGPALLSMVLLALLLFTLSCGATGPVIDQQMLAASEVGATLFGPWLMVVELSALLLLAALVTASHVGRGPEPDVDAGEETGQ